MANPSIRMFAFYLGKKKAATVNQVECEPIPNRSAMFGQEGYLAHSKGAVMMRFKVSEVVPVGGSSGTEILQKVLNQEDIDCGIIIGGQRIKVSCAITAQSFSSEVEGGKATGSITLEGGVPNVQG